MSFTSQTSIWKSCHKALKYTLTSLQFVQVCSVHHINNTESFWYFWVHAFVFIKIRHTFADTPHMLTFALLCEHHLPHSTQQHVELPVAQFHAAAQSVSDKCPQRCQPVSFCLLAKSLPLAEGHHDLTKCDVQSQRLHCQSWDSCRLFTPKGQASRITAN